MSDLDQTIETMAKQQVISKIQENAVRIKRFNVRYTSQNRKNTPERLNDIFKSYERLTREIVREFIKVEKSARLKYREPLSQERVKRLTMNIDTEIDLVLSQLTKEYQGDFHRYASEVDFDGQIEKLQEDVKKRAEKEIQKTVDTLDNEITTVSIISPDELSRIYEIEERSLVEMGVVSPLQSIHKDLDVLGSASDAPESFEQVKEALKMTAAIPLQLERSGDNVSVDERKRKKILIVKAYDLFKDLALNIRSLIEQLKLPKDLRNCEMNEKLWRKTVGLFEGFEQSEQILPKVKFLFDRTKE